MNAMHIDAVNVFLENVVVPGRVARLAAKNKLDGWIEELEGFGPLSRFLLNNRERYCRKSQAKNKVFRIDLFYR